MYITILSSGYHHHNTAAISRQMANYAVPHPNRNNIIAQYVFYLLVYFIYILYIQYANTSEYMPNKIFRFSSAYSSAKHRHVALTMNKKFITLYKRG